MTRNYEGMTKYEYWVLIETVNLIRIRSDPDKIDLGPSGIDANDLASFLHEPVGPLCDTLKILEEKGFIKGETYSDESDKITITKEGWRIFDSWEPSIDDLNPQVRNMLEIYTQAKGISCEEAFIESLEGGIEIVLRQKSNWPSN